MKWWGWGEDGVAFTHEDKPDLGPVIRQVLGLRVGPVTEPPPRLAALAVPDSRLPEDLRGALERAVGPQFVSVQALDRVVHARGKSLRDLVRQRRGDFDRIPDAVVRPGDEEAIAETVRAAVEWDAVVIPFGGGSSISGSLEAPADETRPVISVDLSR
ncbi:MAG: FAD-binding protein, partial [Solirubrobacteraceae bacterium]